MDILYLGQKPIGERIFFSLILPHLNKNLVVCSNTNTSNWWNSNKIYNYCRINKINFIDNCKRNENLIIKFIKSNKINCILSVQHKWILSKKIIDSVDGNAFNLHLASLPEYKGSCGLNIALLNNKKSINATLHLLTKEVDNGPIIYQKSVRISSVDNAWTLYKKLEEAGFKIFEKLLTNIKNKKISFLRRNEKKGKFYNYSSLDKFRVIQSKEINNDTFVRSRALSFKNFKK
mgnify:FL=1